MAIKVGKYKIGMGYSMRRIKVIFLITVLAFVMASCNVPSTASSESLSGSEETTEVVSADETSGNSEDASAQEESEREETASEEVSEEASENVSDRDSEEVSENASEEADSEEVSEEEESEEPEFTVEEYNAVLYVKKAVNVRTGPSTDYNKIGGLNKGDQIQITGIANTGWYQIQYNDAIAYVASSYLIDEASYQAMIAEEEAALAAQQAAEQQAAAEQAAAQQQAVEQAAQQQDQGDYKAQVVALMNQERAAAGVGGISQNASLDAVAQIRAQEIVQSFSHTRPNGSSCFTVLDENGIAYMTAGENIAAGYGDPASVMNGWMNSEGHRANILNGSFGQVGIGYYTDPNSGYGTYWVQIFTN